MLLIYSAHSICWSVCTRREVGTMTWARNLPKCAQFGGALSKKVKIQYVKKSLPILKSIGTKYYLEVHLILRSNDGARKSSIHENCCSDGMLVPLLHIYYSIFILFADSSGTPTYVKERTHRASQVAGCYHQKSQWQSGQNFNMNKIHIHTYNT